MRKLNNEELYALGDALRKEMESMANRLEKKGLMFSYSWCVMNVTDDIGSTSGMGMTDIGDESLKRYAHSVLCENASALLEEEET